MSKSRDKVVDIVETLATVVSDLCLGLEGKSREILNKFISGCLPDEAFLSVSCKIFKAFVQESQRVCYILIRTSLNVLAEIILNSAQYD